MERTQRVLRGFKLHFNKRPLSDVQILSIINEENLNLEQEKDAGDTTEFIEADNEATDRLNQEKLEKKGPPRATSGSKNSGLPSGSTGQIFVFDQIFANNICKFTALYRKIFDVFKYICSNSNICPAPPSGSQVPRNTRSTVQKSK